VLRFIAHERCWQKQLLGFLPFCNAAHFAISRNPLWIMHLFGALYAKCPYFSAWTRQAPPPLYFLL
jgi:hypothetical protein